MAGLPPHARSAPPFDQQRLARRLLYGGIIGLYGYLFLPWLLAFGTPLFTCTNMEGCEEASADHARRLALLGRAAVPAVIHELRERSPWQRGYAHLPYALRDIGPHAHRALLAAIDEERDPDQRAYLVSALLRGFADASRLDGLLADFSGERLSFWALSHLAWDVHRALPEAPPLIDPDRDALNPAFLTFWEGRRVTLAEAPR